LDSQTRKRWSWKLLGLLAVFTMTTSLMAVAAEPAPLEVPSDLSVPSSYADSIKALKGERHFIVLMEADPISTCDGDIAGLRATKVREGKKVNTNSKAARAYQAYLEGAHNTALSSVGSVDAKVLDYSVVFNGFSAMLTGAQAAELLGRDDVLMVWEDELRSPTTDNSPEYLGLSGAEGVWTTSGLSGDGVIIGVIDTGIEPEHPSFSDREGNAVVNGKNGKGHSDTLTYRAPAGWTGTCESGEQFSQDDCNNKLIGASSYRAGFGKHKAISAEDFDSPRDFNGHGTHTSSTAGGNAITDAWDREISGMAPRAYIAMYKACWEDGGNGGCASSDLVAAIDQAVADGVDVINYSIGGSSTDLATPDSIAFLFAEAADVFVATSNGNSGPGFATTGSPASAPWVTSVGALNHKSWTGEIVLGNGTFTGASAAEATNFYGAEVVDARTLGNELCVPGDGFSEGVTGKVVLCWRGDIARVDKSLAVSNAGGIGMVLSNQVGGAQSLVPDVHSVPSIHVDPAQGETIEAYIAGGGTTAISIEGSLGGVGAIAGFSSVGPGGSADIIKPDISASGVSVLAAFPAHWFGAPPGTATSAHLSGTSMSSPHMAGLGALMVEAHPGWSPSAIKSAFITTADFDATLSDDGASAPIPFQVGSGLAQMGAALNPGIVYETSFFEYAAFSCGIAPIFSQGSCDFLAGLGYTEEASDLNQANIAIGDLAGTQTVTRTVTSTLGGDVTYLVSVDAPAGIDVVAPTSVDVPAGGSASFEVTFTTDGATLGSYSYGSMTLAHGPHVATSRLAIRPVQAAVDAAITGTGTSGSADISINFGYTGDYTAEVNGLAAAATELGNVVDDPTNDINSALGSGVGITLHTVEIPAGTTYARFSLFDDETDGADDLDLYVFDPGFGFVGGSGSGTSAEEVNVRNPSPGTYYVIVHGWQTDGADSNYTLYSWAVGGDEGNMTATGPLSAVLGAEETITVNWSGLAADMKYLGYIGHEDGGGEFAITTVRIDS